jgi:hypothetical protein
MSTYYLSSEGLIDSIKRRASVPENQVTFDKTDFLELANEEMLIGLVPSILQFHEDYFLFEEAVPLEENVTEYTIPYRSIGNKLRDVQYKLDDKNYNEMTRIAIDNRFEEFDNGLLRYYIKNNKVVIASTHASPQASLAMIYYIRPSKLVLEEDIGVITSINRTTGEIATSGLPTKFSTNIKYDFYKVKSPHRILKIDLNAATINPTTNTLTFAPSDIPSDLEVGDHVSQAEESNIPQIPTELHAVLAHRVACRILEAIGDTQGLQNANVKLAEMEMKTGNLIDDRVEGSPKKVINRHTPLRKSVYSKRYSRR